MGTVVAGPGGSATFNSGIKHLAAQDFVLIDEGFVADGNGMVIISTMPCQAGQTNTSTFPSFPTNATLRSIENSKRSTEQY